MTHREFMRQTYIELAHESIALAKRSRTEDIRYSHASLMEDAAYYRAKAKEARG